MENTTKDTSYDYGREYQLRQKAKYLNRDNNHWKIKNNLIFDLVEKSLDGNNKENKDINIVDVGCSIGTFAIEFAKKEYSTFGVDFDSTALEIARELAEEEGVQTEFICDDIANFSNTERSLDIAVCADIFEHLHDDELGSMLVSIRKSLSEGGEFGVLYISN